MDTTYKHKKEPEYLLSNLIFRSAGGGTQVAWVLAENIDRNIFTDKSLYATPFVNVDLI